VFTVPLALPPSAAGSVWGPFINRTSTTATDSHSAISILFISVQYVSISTVTVVCLLSVSIYKIQMLVFAIAVRSIHTFTENSSHNNVSDYCFVYLLPVVELQGGPRGPGPPERPGGPLETPGLRGYKGPLISPLKSNSIHDCNISISFWMILCTDGDAPSPAT